MLASQTSLQKGQLLRPVHPNLAKREWGLREDSVGSVLCCYRSLTDGADHVDIAFEAGRVVWAAPAVEFAPADQKQT